MISNDKQLYHWNRAQRRLNNKLSKGDPYTEKNHRDWCDEHNKGITNYGVHPDMLPRDLIRFDIFHLRSAITKKLMEYLRSFINKQSHETIQEFSKVLLTFWGDYHVCLWRLNKVFTSFNGNEIKDFIYGIPFILMFLNKSFEITDELKLIQDGLWAWYNIVPFFNIVQYENEDHFKESNSKFEFDLKIFYAAGAKTFFTKRNTGDLENPYSHVLRFYLPKHAKTTWDRHQLGLGIFSMQGFERRNKESKNTYRRFTNHKHNGCVQNLRRLWDIFEYDTCNT